MKHLVKFKTEERLIYKTLILCDTQKEADEFLADPKVKQITRNKYRSIKNAQGDRGPAFRPANYQQSYRFRGTPNGKNTSRNRKWTPGRKQGSGKLHNFLSKKGAFVGKGILKPGYTEAA